MTIRAYKIDEDTGDLVFVAGRPQLVEGAEAIAQSIRYNLRLIKGEWPFDVSQGVDYFDVVNVKGTSRNAVEAEFTNAIESTRGVVSIDEIQFVYDNAGRALSVTYKATVDSGKLISETVEI